MWLYWIPRAVSSRTSTGGFCLHEEVCIEHEGLAPLKLSEENCAFSLEVINQDQIERQVAIASECSSRCFQMLIAVAMPMKEIN